MTKNNNPRRVLEAYLALPKSSVLRQAMDTASGNTGLPLKDVVRLINGNHALASVMIAALEAGRRQEENYRRLADALRTATNRYEVLQSSTEVDAMTELPNMRGLRRMFKATTALAHETGEPFTIAYGDLDGMKALNGRYGEPCVNGFIAEIGAFLRDNIRRPAYPARPHETGDEFVVIMPGLEYENAGRVLERLISGVKELDLTNATRVYHPRMAAPMLDGMTFGTYTPDNMNIEELDNYLSNASLAMHAAKERGMRGRVLPHDKTMMK